MKLTIIAAAARAVCRQIFLEAQGKRKHRITALWFDEGVDQ